MNIKLIIATRLSYYFCGSVALSSVNTKENPLTVSLEGLNKQEILGLNKAIKTKVIALVEGEKEFEDKVSEYLVKKDKEVIDIVVTVPEESVEEVNEIVTESVETIVEVEKTEEVKEETVTEEVKPTRRRTTTTKK